MPHRFRISRGGSAVRAGPGAGGHRARCGAADCGAGAWFEPGALTRIRLEGEVVSLSVDLGRPLHVQMGLAEFKAAGLEIGALVRLIYRMRRCSAIWGLEGGRSFVIGEEGSSFRVWQE